MNNELKKSIQGAYNYMLAVENAKKVRKEALEERNRIRERGMTPSCKMRYADYLGQRKPINKKYLAPLNAKPKMTNKDSHRSRDIEKRLQERKLIQVNNLDIPKRGYLVRKTKNV